MTGSASTVIIIVADVIARRALLLNTDGTLFRNQDGVAVPLVITGIIPPSDKTQVLAHRDIRQYIDQGSKDTDFPCLQILFSIIPPAVGADQVAGLDRLPVQPWGTIADFLAHPHDISQQRQDHSRLSPVCRQVTRVRSTALYLTAMIRARTR